MDASINLWGSASHMSNLIHHCYPEQELEDHTYDSTHANCVLSIFSRQTLDYPMNVAANLVKLLSLVIEHGL